MGRDRGMLRLQLLLATLLLLLPSIIWCGSGSGSVPRFTLEPASRVRFLTSAGTRLHCAAAGDPPPALAWLADDNTELRDQPGVRRVYANGTLELLPAVSRTVTAPATVRCRAVNAHGTTLSRDVTLEPVLDVEWELSVVAASAAAAGGAAALSCRAAPAGVPLRRARWLRQEQLLDLQNPTPESRYIAAGDTLLIRDVTARDAGAYSCQAQHDLSAVTKRSPPAHLTVTNVVTRWAPRLVAAAGDVHAAPDARVCLPCAAVHQQPPHYTWYREWEGRLQPVTEEGREGAWLWSAGAALCGTARALAGAWLCKAYNAFGDAARQVRLHLDEPLTVTVTPDRVVAEAGGTVRLSCTASVQGAVLEWLHAGRTAGTGSTLVVRDVTRAAQGVYQCRARTPADHAQATAELVLGDSPPELQYTFIEQVLRAGGAVSLRCAAAGAPPPRLAWLLDDQPLDQYRTHRYLISSETTVRGDVVSTLNITAASVADGGRYSCHAYNRLGDAEHSARLNIYGPPLIRAAGPVRVVAGSNATVHCPYAGYPISSISWWRRGGVAALGSAGRVAARDATLRFSPALMPDAGHYSCAVAAPDGTQARRDIEIQVRNPPKISPFMFSSELTEGSSAQVLCGVSSGDKPMYFSWTKDGAPLSSSLQIEEKSLNEFSLLMFSDLSARHSGEYTCRVSNHAASVNYTAALSVKVAPSWVTEPLDAAVLLGASILLECAAKGHPVPTITWYRKIGESGLGPENDQWEQVGGGWKHTDVGARVSEREVEMVVRDGVLTASAATRRLHGLYRCTADNGVGPPLLKHVNLTVHEPANFERSAGNISCVRGHSASLSCHALGDAPLAVHWSHRGTRLDLNSYRWTISEVRTVEGVRSTLQLRASERGDAGEYRCHAHNQYGRSELLMFLHVEEPPEAPRGVRLAGVGSRWVRVAWSVSAARAAARAAGERYSALCTALHSLPGAEPLHNTYNLTLVSDNDDSSDTEEFQTLTAKLDGLRPAAAYSLRIVAENHVGQSPHSEPLLLTTLDEAPSAPPQNVRVRPAGPGELHVSWSAPVQDSWNSELLGYAVTWRELGRYGEESEEDTHAGRLTSAGWSSAELTVTGLRPATRLAVAVRAYSRAGAGPASPLVYATTVDGVPEDPPKSVTCEAASSRSLEVRWTEPLGAEAPRGYDVHFIPLYPFPPWSVAAQSRLAHGPATTLAALAPATNYSVWVCARSTAGSGPPSAPVTCATRDDVPGPVTELRALAAGADALRVTWLPPTGPPSPTHYTLYSREFGKSSSTERAVRVEGGAEGEEVRRDVRGLRSVLHELWVVAASRAGVGAPSHPVSIAPAEPGSARVSSLGRDALVVRRGASVRLRCAALGAAPLRWSWSPLPPTHAITELGDLILHKVEPVLSGNYTCSVRNAGGADAVSHRLLVVSAPSAAALRLARAEPHALHVAWSSPTGAGGMPPLGYTLRWARESSSGAAASTESRRELPGSARAAVLRRLACGTRYHVTLQVHSAAGASAPSSPLRARTEGDKAVPATGKEFVWANSSALRLNLLAWRVRCPPTWRLALRALADPSAPWTNLDSDQESAQATGLKPGTWYEIRAAASSPAGETVALYRAATRTLSGERIGEAVEVVVEARGARPEGAVAGGGAWHAGIAPALLGGLLAVLLAAIVGLVSVRWRAAAHSRRHCAPQPALQQLYSTEPAKRNGKALTPLEGDMDEISPYATFSMSGGGEGSGACAGAGCAVQVQVQVPSGGGCALHTFGRSESLELTTAPPPRPNLLSHPEYVRGRDSDSESSGSSACAACAHHPPPATRTGTAVRQVARVRRRREPAGAAGAERHAPPPPAGAVAARYFSPASLDARSRQEAL